MAENPRIHWPIDLSWGGGLLPQDHPKGKSEICTFQSAGARDRMVSRRCVSKGAMWYVAVTASKCYIKIGLTNFLKRVFFCGTKDVWCNHAWKSPTPLVTCLLILVLSSPSSTAGAFFVAALLGQWTVEQCSKPLVFDDDRHRGLFLGLKKPRDYHNQREIPINQPYFLKYHVFKDSHQGIRRVVGRAPLHFAWQSWAAGDWAAENLLQFSRHWQDTWMICFLGIRMSNSLGDFGASYQLFWDIGWFDWWFLAVLA